MFKKKITVRKDSVPLAPTSDDKRDQIVRLKKLRDSGISIQVFKEKTPNYVVGVYALANKDRELAKYKFDIYLDTTYQEINRKIDRAEDYLLELSNSDVVPDHLNEIFNIFNPT
jgi:hypothetical protein